MKRWLIIVCIVGACLIALLGLLNWSDREAGKKAKARMAAAGQKSQPTPINMGGGDAPERLAPAFATVSCVAETSGRLVAMMGGQVIAADGTSPSVSLPPGLWWIQWQTEARSVDLGHVDVDVGDVLTCTINDESSTLRGRVRTRSGRTLKGATVTVHCGNYNADTTSDDRGLFSFDVPPVSMAGACTLSASVQTGLLSRQSEAEEISAFDRSQSVEIELDDRPVAGLGIGLLPMAAGVQVGEVFHGSPAERAGIQPGDLIVAVDGTSVVGMSAPDFKKLATGEEGSTVQLKVYRGESQFTVQFRREKIEEPKDTGAPHREGEAPEHGGDGPAPE